MPPPSYPHRYLLLTDLLDSLSTPCPPDAFSQDGASNQRGCQLDALLLQGWTATGRAAQLLDKDVLQHAENLRLKKSDFEVLGRIGEGQFGVVDAVRSKLNGKVYAMKSIEKHMAMRAGSQLNLLLERHIHCLSSVSSPAPSFVATFQSPTTLHLVTTYASCGSLWDRLCEMLPVPGLDTGKMDEDEVGWWGRQMIEAISWFHGLGYVHRDIKPHNFLLLPDSRLLLTDFGSAAPLTRGAVSRSLCLLPTGTPDYVAPEVLRIAEDALVEAAHSDADETNGTIRQSEAAGYGCEVDWWSLGATLYEMSAGRAPFFSPSIGSTYDRIMRCDVRMPNDLSPQLKSLLSGLLSPLDVRLGKNEIEKHSFFREVDASSPPHGLVCQPIDLGTLADTFDHTAEEDITFDHFFNTTVGFTTMSSPSMIAPATWGRWVGWTLDPPAEFFGSEPPPVITVSPPTLKAATNVRQHSAPPATNLFTPMRTGLRGATPPTVPRTAPRSVPRTRPVSERQAFAELIKCVQASARKKLASTVKMPGSASTVSSTASAGWRKDHPPTPTPVSRDVTVTTLINRPSSRASLRDDLARPLSRASGDEPMFPPRTLSRASSLSLRDRYILPPRSSFSRTSSLPVRDLLSMRTDSMASLRSTRTITPRNETPSHDPTPTASAISRSLSLTSVRGSDRPRANTSSLKDDTFLAKLCAVEDERPPSRKSSLSSGSTATVREREPQLVREVISAPVPFSKRSSPLADTPSLKSAPSTGDRYGSMKVWHENLEDGLTSLERRLAGMLDRLNREV